MRRSVRRHGRLEPASCRVERRRHSRRRRRASDRGNTRATPHLSSIGGSASQQFFDDGFNGGDAVAGNNVFTYTATVSPLTTAGPKSLPFTVSDNELRSGSGSISLTVQQPPPPVDHLVISQIYGGGGNSGATFSNDYVELYNPTGISFNLAGWSLQYASATGTSWTNKQPLGGTIAPGEYFLVALASGGANGSPLPVAANISGDINMSATTGKVALVSNAISLSGSCPNGTDPDVVDFSAMERVRPALKAQHARQHRATRLRCSGNSTARRIQIKTATTFKPDARIQSNCADRRAWPVGRRNRAKL